MAPSLRRVPIKIIMENNYKNYISPIYSLLATGPAGSIRGNDHRIVREAATNSKHREHFLTNLVTQRWNQLPSKIVIHQSNYLKID